MEEKNQNRGLMVVIIILLLVIIALICVIGYMMLDKGSKSDIIDNSSEELKNEDKDLQLVDYINKKFDKNTINKDLLAQYSVCGALASDSSLGTNEVILPMIKSEKVGAKQFNEAIQNEYQDQIKLLTEDGIKDELEKIVQENPNVVHKLSSAILGGDSTINYEYKNSNEYITVLVTSSGGSPCASGGVSTNSFTYDIKNDKYLNNDEVLERFNITKQMIKQAIVTNQPALEFDSSLESALNDSFEDLFYLWIENNTLTIGSNRGLGDNRPQDVSFSIANK